MFQNWFCPFHILKSPPPPPGPQRFHTVCTITDSFTPYHQLVTFSPELDPPVQLNRLIGYCEGFSWLEKVLSENVTVKSENVDNLSLFIHIPKIFRNRYSLQSLSDHVFSLQAIISKWHWHCHDRCSNVYGWSSRHSFCASWTGAGVRGRGDLKMWNLCYILYSNLVWHSVAVKIQYALMNGIWTKWINIPPAMCVGRSTSWLNFWSMKNLLSWFESLAAQ